MRAVLTIFVVAYSLAFWHSVRASADTGTSVTTGAGTIDSGVTSNNGAPGDSSSTPPPCAYFLVELPPSEPIAPSANPGDFSTDPASGGWYAKICGPDYKGVFYIGRVDPGDLLAEARRRLSLPFPVPHTSPTGEQLVNVPTWLWIDGQSWHALRSTASVPGVSVTVIAEPFDSVWSMGDGSQVTCAGTGTPFDPARSNPAAESSCSHTYRHSSAGEIDQQFHGSVTVQWRATWSVTGAPGGGNLDSLFRTTSFAESVSEVEALNRTAAGS
jgi:hypothetical protein